MTKKNVRKNKESQIDLTHAEIAKELGLTRSAVSLAEKSALAKLRKALRARHNIRKSGDLL